MLGKNKQAGLIFSDGLQPTGFNVLAEQSKPDSAIAIRELVQNAMDAGQEIDREKTIIRFETASHKPADIPAFAAYKKAFLAAVKFQTKMQGGELPDTAQSVVNAIAAKVDARKIDTLFVMDNGIGLNEKRMNALLGEGISAKSGDGGGSYGYGHSTIIPASALRYMLYGGICDGKQIAAGHAVLASFTDKNARKAKDGFYIMGVGKSDSPFDFPTDKQIPDIIKNRLDEMAKKWRSGAMVMIPGFNYFDENPDELWQSIEKAAACNFFAAIHKGKLRIEFSNGKDECVLDKTSVGMALEKHADEKVKKHSLAGYYAQEAYKTLKNGKSHNISTKLGKVKIKLRALTIGERSRVELCRNGMHITHDITNLKRADFADYAPFHAVVLADITSNDFHRFIRKAEPPKHNAIEIRRLDKAEKLKMREATNEIKDFIKENIDRLETEEFKIDDVLNISGASINTLDELPPRVRVGGNNGAGNGLREGDSAKGEGVEGGNDGDFNKAGNAMPFHATPVQTGARSYEVQIRVPESTHDNEIRFTLDEGLDLTCDSSQAEDFVQLKKVKIDGRAVAAEYLIENGDKHVLGIRLGANENPREMILKFDFAIPETTGIKNNTPVALKTEMVRRKIEKEV